MLKADRPKVAEDHLARRACLYVRQSSLHQVRFNEAAETLNQHTHRQQSGQEIQLLPHLEYSRAQQHAWNGQS